MNSLRIITSGRLEVFSPGTSGSLRFPTRKAEALVAYLAITGRPTRRDVFCSMLWGDSERIQARHSLRQTLSAIRATLRPHQQLLVVNGDLVSLDWRRTRVDVHLIERLRSRGTRGALRLACALSGGELLAGLELKEAEFDGWLGIERTRAQQVAVEVHERYAAMLISSREEAAAIQVAQRLVELDPLHERGHRTLMLLYARQGHLGAALRQYDVCARILQHQLGVNPGQETQQIRRHVILSREHFPTRLGETNDLRSWCSPDALDGREMAKGSRRDEPR